MRENESMSEKKRENERYSRNDMAKKQKTKKENNNKGKYREWLEPESLILIEGWRRDGLSDSQIAHNIGIDRTTLHRWRRTYAPFATAYKKGSEVSLYEVENALFKSAKGYDVTETEQEEIEYPDGTKVIKKRARKRHIPPNTGALCFLLKNRLPEKWKDKQLIESQNDGMLAQLIDGLKEPQPEVIDTIEATATIKPEEKNDIHPETEKLNEVMADQ